MWLLLAVSLFWAVSFGLIKGGLTGLDSGFVAFARLSLSLLVFLPFLRTAQVPRRLLVELPLLGAVQYGLMYSLYIASYEHLQAHEVALFTVTTPLLVVLYDDALSGRLHKRALLAALIAVAGAAVISQRGSGLGDVWLGFALLQGSNLCFALGQVRYRRLMHGQRALTQASHFALLYLGAALLTGLEAALTGGLADTAKLTSEQAWTLLYLGVVPSGVCFFLWNVGATKATPGVLAVMNNAKVPLGVLVSLTIFGEEASLPRLVVGGALVAGAALWAARSPRD